ncbi:MAG: hypothetical protein FGM62_02245 [Methylobacterium sp.]|nr:hypothetical protein [Methylobacterium sp.]
MLFNFFFNAAQAEAFAKTLAADFMRECPVHLVQGGGKGGNKKLVAAIQHLNGKARQFNRQNRPGLFKKAKLSNMFKWELKEHGYDDDLIDELIKGMLIAMAARD